MVPLVEILMKMLVNTYDETQLLRTFPCPLIAVASKSAGIHHLVVQTSSKEICSELRPTQYYRLSVSGAILEKEYRNVIFK